MKALTQRQQNILCCIIQRYVETATPVASKHLVKSYQMDCSSATVRNEMVNLEKMGYISQPHTSAGRIPTDRGYRFYVDSLMKWEHLDSQTMKSIKEPMINAKGDMNLILEAASQILGKISKELSVVLTPWISWGIFDRLELIALTMTKILVVIHVQSRLVKTVIIEVDSDLETKDLEKTAQLLNERLHGLTLEEIKNTIGLRLHDVRKVNRSLLNQVMDSASFLFDFSEPLDIHTCGTQNIISQPEFTDTNMLEHILSLIDDRRDLIDLFHRKTKRIEVTIGRENADEKLQSFTIVRSSYTRGRDVGTLGIIGPIRMHYQAILPLVDCMTKTMSKLLS
jgi:heat-inducible transcriptional repressor